MANVRPPARAGQFYPASEGSLRKKIEEVFAHELGFGEVPESVGGDRVIKAGVVPHAGYDFSGPVASHVYGNLVQDGFPETFIIFGPKHGRTSIPAAVTKETFDMPMGKVPVDEELADEVNKGPIKLNPEMHVET